MLPSVRNVRSHHDAPLPDSGPSGGSGGPGGDAPRSRLNLLLSYAGFSDDSWVDRLPLLLEPLGVHSLRAGNCAEATRVIQHFPVHIAVVDLGLPMERLTPGNPDPAEAGPRILELLRRLDAPPPIVVVKPARSHRDDARQIAAALRAGVYAVVDRPHGQGDLELMLGVLQRCLRRFYHNRWPGASNC